MNLLWLGEASCHDPLRVGPKAAHCSVLKEKFNVPPGFCIPALEVHAKKIDENPIALTPELKREISENYQKLGKLMGVENPKVAVRSSAIDEDNPDASFAGQHDTFLNVVGDEMLFDCIEKCWDSAQHQYVQEYRKQHGLNLNHVRIAVMVQALVSADISAVAFSINPVSENFDEILINGNFGLGKSIVDGAVNPDNYLVDKKDPSNIIKSEINQKEIMTVLLEKGTEDQPVPRLLRKKAAFQPEQLTEIAKMIMELEKFQGYPVDIELAYHNGILYLLQCRPISTFKVYGGY